MIAPLSAADVSPIWHPFTQHATAGPMIEIVRGEGAWLYAGDGRRILDAISSWWVNTHGHGHPKIAAAVAEQARTLEQVIFAGFTHPPAERLARKLLALAPRRAGVRLLLRLRLDRRRGRREDGGRLLAQSSAGRATASSPSRTATTAIPSARCRSARAACSPSPYQPMLFQVDFLPFPAPGREQRTIDAFAALLRTSRRRDRRADRRAAGAGRRRHADVSACGAGRAARARAAATTSSSSPTR